MSGSVITLSYDSWNLEGIFRRGPDISDGVWIRLRTEADLADRSVRHGKTHLALGWPAALTVLRVLSQLQSKLGFTFATDESSTIIVNEFITEYRSVRKGAAANAVFQTDSAAEASLIAAGWDISKRKLKQYQFANLRQLAALPHGANFSVPGAGKTTVTWALHLLLRDQLDCILVVAPKNAFPAWNSIIEECMSPSASISQAEPFTMLVGGENQIVSTLSRGSRRWIISYDQMIRVEGLIERLLATRKTHLVLDESHRMKEGHQSKRGAALLSISYLAKRRDILSGTPMPQGPLDMESQLDFLLPGFGLGNRIARGEKPRVVLGTNYVRTTKRDLNLPARELNFVNVKMNEAQLALYSVIKEDIRAQASVLRSGRSAFDLARARRSVMRLLQAASVPEALASTLTDSSGNLPRLVRAAITEGPSARIVKAVEMARELANSGRKVLIWTIFTAAVERLRNLLGDLNPAVIYGAISTGSEDDEGTREGNLKKFKQDKSCWVMIANPAAASEGMSLHMHCHDAIYVDRSYNAAHYLQSIDRIHRLGLPEDVLTNIYILRNELPLGVGSVDFSVGRRLKTKIHNLEQLLEDPDLNDLALDEENAGVAIDESISIEDIDDLIQEIEGRGQRLADGLV